MVLGNDVVADLAQLRDVHTVAASILRAASALLRMLASGWSISCAIEAESCPSADTRDRRANSSRCCADCASACLRSVTSTAIPMYEKRAVGLETRHAMIHNPAILTVESAQAVFHREWPPRVEITGIDFKAAVEVIPMDTFCPPIANFLLQPATGEVEPALVEKGTALVRGRHPDHHGCGVGHSAKARLTLPDEVHPRPPFREQHRQKHERESGRDEEQLERQHVLGRTVRGERPAPVDGAGDRQACDDQDARIESERANRAAAQRRNGKGR